MSKIHLPNDWVGRHYQQDLGDYMFSDPPLERKRAACVWHRRAGKDSFSLNFAAVAAHQRVGTIWHMLPTLNQGRKVIWNGIDREGRRMIDQAFPKELRKSTNQSEMMIEFKNGSIWQVVGSDNYDSLVGSNPMGVIFSEYSVANPAAWDYMRPILAENDGWAIFIYTPRGNNHGKKLFDMAESNPAWYATRLTIDDTHRDDGTPVISQEIIDEERASGMDEQKIQQEYFCSWDAGLAGSYYIDQLQRAEAEGRIGDFPWIEGELVYTYWDLGIGDHNSIGFFQYDGEYIRVIDHVSKNGWSMEKWIKYCRELPYVYGGHTGPHDLKNREYSSGRTREEIAADLGFRFEYAAKVTRDDGINAVRSTFGRLRFNKNKTEDLRESLYNYRKEWDEKLQRFKDVPLHDWSSHDADMFRYFAVSWEDNKSPWATQSQQFRRGRKPKVKTAIGSGRGRMRA